MKNIIAQNGPPGIVLAAKGYITYAKPWPIKINFLAKFILFKRFYNFIPD